MEFYLSGCLVVLLINIVTLVRSNSAISPTRISNVKKVGLYFHYSDRRFSSVPPKPFAYFRYLFWVVCIEPLLSWINVAFVIFAFVSSKVRKKSDLPQSRLEQFKELDFQLNNVDQPRRAVKQLVQEVSGHFLKSEAGERLWFAQIDGCTQYELNESDSFARDLYVICPMTKRIHRTWSVKNDAHHQNSVFEYRIESGENPKLFIRTIESSRNWPGIPQDAEYLIKDGVILEKAIAFDISQSLQFKLGNDDRSKAQSEIEWQEVGRLKLKFWIFDCHCDLLPDSQFYSLVRAEIGTIEKSQVRVRAFLDKFNGKIISYYSEDLRSEMLGLRKDLDEIRLRNWNRAIEKVKASKGNSDSTLMGKADWDLVRAEEIALADDSGAKEVLALSSEIWSFLEKMEEPEKMYFKAQRDLLPFFESLLIK